MITIEEVASLLDAFELCGVGSTEHAHLIEGAPSTYRLAISQHEDIERLKRERDEAFERAAQVCVVLNVDEDRCKVIDLKEQAWEEGIEACIKAIRALKSEAPTNETGNARPGGE